MSERWGVCVHCQGTGSVPIQGKWRECEFCLGTAGFSGHAFEMHLQPKRCQAAALSSLDAIERAIKALKEMKK